ncbi:hypothetical protein J6590_101491 [Homalodisca vitripennis]|nr:hypothetical protein J6590_101491 [Homalodisca vitripennis]
MKQKMIYHLRPVSQKPLIFWQAKLIINQGNINRISYKTLETRKLKALKPNVLAQGAALLLLFIQQQAARLHVVLGHMMRSSLLLMWSGRGKSLAHKSFSH